MKGISSESPLCSLLSTQNHAGLKDRQYTMLLSAPPAAGQPQHRPFSIIGLFQMKCTLLCIMLTVCWPSSVTSFSEGPEFVFFLFCVDQVILTSCERHTYIYQNIQDSSVLSCPISGSKVKVEHVGFHISGPRFYWYCYNTQT